MAVSIYQKQLTEELKDQTVELYKQGLSMRAVAERVGRSHQWVALVVRERLSPTAPN